MKNRTAFSKIALLVLSVLTAVLVFTSCDMIFNKPDSGEECQHTYGEWETVTEASCTADGKEKRSCTKEGCDEVEERAIPKIAHSFSSDLKSNATQHWKECACGAIGESTAHVFSSTYQHDDYSHWFVCECGVKSEIVKHDYDEGVVKTPATCTSTGIATVTCKTCNFQTESVIEKTDHTYSGDFLGDQTGHWKKCDNCTAVTRVEAHSWDEGTLVKASTCTVKGSKVFVCPDCDYTKTMELPLASHDYEGVIWTTDDDAHWKKCKNCDATSQNGDHAWGTGSILTAPSCTVDGVRVFTCSTCAKTKTATEPATGHDYHGVNWTTDANAHWKKCKNCDATSSNGNHAWGEGVVTTAPTCTEDGVRTFTCPTCNRTKTETEAKTGHDFEGVNWTTDGNAHWKKCKNCDATSANGDHVWGEGVVTTAPNCTEDGVRTFTCSTCNKTKTAAEPKTGHDFEDVSWTTDGNAHWKKCKNCDATSANGEHVWGDGEVTDEPTCTKDGVRTFTCSTCNKTKTAAEPKKQHDYDYDNPISDETGHWYKCKNCPDTTTESNHVWGEGEVTDEPTCTEDGVRTFTCSTCNKTKTERVPKNGHNFENASWTTDGNAHWKKCNNCDFKDQLGDHVWGQGEVTTEPTCTEEGVRTFTCSICNKTKTEAEPENGHDFEDVDWTTTDDAHWKKCKNCDATSANGDHVWGEGEVTTEPTCTEDGVRTFTCATCNKTKTAVEPKNGHDFEDVSWTTDGNAHWKKCKNCDFKDQLGDHVWGEGEVTTEPSCTEDGVRTFTCSTCNKTKTETVVATGHDFADAIWSSDDNAHWKKCKNCDATSENGDHAWKSEILDESSCTEAGEMLYTCTVCQKTKTEKIDLKEHDYQDVLWSYDENGHWLECKNCGAVASESAHSGGEADCANKAICQICQIAYGEVDPTKHEGGTATCTTPAKCTRCEEYYGSTDASNHENTTAFNYKIDSADPTKHNKYYKCCNELAATEAHSGGSATCSTPAKCDLCKELYGDVVASNHIISKVARKAPTCTEPGCEEYWKCSACGDIFADEACESLTTLEALAIEALGHDPIETSRIEANCSDAGSVNYTCSRCEETTSDTIDPLGHDFVHSDEDSVAADCQTIGYNYNKCTVCGELELVEQLPKTACTEVATTVPSTCSVAGKTTYACSVCHKERFVNLPLADHVYSEQTVAVTCLTDGYTLYTCECGYSYKDNVVTSAGQHIYVVDTERSTQVSCTVDGKTVEVCSGCSLEKVTTTDALGHDDVHATCTENAVCHCGAVIENALGHNFVGSEPVVTPASCTKDGYLTFTCQNGDCTETLVESPEELTAKGHTVPADYDDWDQDVKQTAPCNFESYYTVACSVCQEIVGKTESYTNHVYTGKLTLAATCVKPGIMTYTCDCGQANYDDANYYPPVEEGQEIDLHKWAAVGAAVTADGDPVGYTHYCTEDGCDATKTVVDLSSGSVDADTIKQADKVQTGDAELSFDDNAKGNLSGNVSLSANKLTVDELVENNAALLEGIDEEVLERIQNNENGILSLEATVDGETFGDAANGGFGGKVTVKIPYKLQEGDDPNEIVVWYFGSEGLISMKAVYTEIDGIGYATFETEHFSYYTVTRMTPAERCNLYGHNWNGENGRGITYAPSCLEDGFTLRTCLRCKAQEVDNKVDALGHDWILHSETEKSCTEDGVTTYICSRRCGPTGGVTYSVVDKSTGHNYVLDEDNSLVATCTAPGRETYVCTVDGCGHSYTVDTPKRPHVFDEANREVVIGSCTTAGYVRQVCTVPGCGFESITDYVDAPGHKMNSKVIAPTCYSKGYTRHWCVNCNDKFADTDITDMTDEHTWNYPEATCTEDQVCIHCNTLGAKALGHLFSGDDGVCQRCGESAFDECKHEIPDESDPFGSTLTLIKHVPSSCNSHGFDQYKCSVCNKKVKINDPDLDEHKFESFKTVDATCTNAGYVLNVCKKCSKQERIETDPALGHNFVGSSCERCGVSNENFYLNMFESWSDVDGFALTVKDLSFTVSDLVYNEDGTMSWEAYGVVSQIGVAELMLYVDEEGNLHGAAHGEIKIFNGPVANDWATLGMKAVVEDGNVYIYACSDQDSDTYSVVTTVDYLVSMLLGESFNVDSEAAAMLFDFVEQRVLPLIMAFRDYNANEIEDLLGDLVNLVFTARVEDGKNVFYLDYDKLHQLNDDLLNLTVEEIVDKYFGDGSFEALATFIVDFMSLKLSELPEFCESIGIDPNELADVINIFCFMIGAPEEFDIMDVIAEEAYGSYTVSDIIVMMLSSFDNGSEPDHDHNGNTPVNPGYGEGGNEDDYYHPEYDDGKEDIYYPPKDEGGKEDTYYPPEYDDNIVIKPDSKVTFTSAELEGEEPDFITQLVGMIDMIRSTKLYESMMGAENAEMVHGAVAEIIDMIASSISIEITTDESGNILDYEIAVDNFETQVSEREKLNLSITLNLMPGARLDLDLSDVVEQVKAETVLPEMEDVVKSDDEFYGNWTEENYEFNGKYYYAMIQSAEYGIHKALFSEPGFVTVSPSCREWKQMTIGVKYVDEIAAVRMVMLINEDKTEQIMLYVSEFNDDYILLAQNGDKIILTYTDGTVKELDAEKEPDYRDVFPESWWRVYEGYESEYFGVGNLSFYYNPVTEEMTEKSPHNYVLNEELSKAPVNCGEDGYRCYVCEFCGDSYKNYYNEYDHSFVFNPDKSVIAENCGDKNISCYECSSCGESYTLQSIKNHNIGYRVEYMTENESCEYGAICYEMCLDCGYETGYSRTVYGHEYSQKVDFDGVNVSYQNLCRFCGRQEGEERVHFTVDTEYELKLVEKESNYWTTVFTFTPDEGGIYELFSYDLRNSDPRVCVYTNDGQFRWENYDHYYDNGYGKDEGRNFALELELIAGVTYYIRVDDSYGFNEKAFKVALRQRTVEQIDLADYGCECGGKMIITSDFIYKEVGFELNCNAKYDNPCPDCGFYYYVDGGMSYDEHCREVVYYNVFLGTEDMESPDKYPVYSIFTGNTQHSMDHKYDNGELYGEDGKRCGHYNENYAYCYNCESVIEKNREESYYDEYGRTVLYKSIRYKWSDSEGEAVLSYVSEEFYANIFGEEGDNAEYGRVRYKETHYGENGEVTYWRETSYSYDEAYRCHVTATTVDSKNSTNTETYYEHSSTGTVNKDSYTGEYKGIPVTVITERQLSVCLYCQAVTGCSERIRYLDENGIAIANENRYYNPDNTEILQRSELFEYSYYLSNAEKPYTYNTLQLYRHYDEQGNLSGVDGWRRDYSDHCHYQHYELYFDEKSGEVSEYFMHESTDHREYTWYYVLHDGATSCEGGVDEVYGCRACGEIEQRNEYVRYEHNYNIANKMIDGVVYTVTECETCGQTEGKPERYFGITADMDVELERNDGDSVYLSFTPTVSGYYMIYSEGNYRGDPYAALMDMYYNSLVEDHDGGEEWNFGINVELVAGEKYLLRVSSMHGAGVVIEYATVEEIDLSEYGCECGGKITVYNFIDEIVRVSSLESISCETKYDSEKGVYYCINCGFAYSSRGYNEYVDCEEIYYHSFIAGNINDPIESFETIELLSYKTGNTYHSDKWFDSYKEEDLTDEQGNKVVVSTSEYGRRCNECGKVLYNEVNVNTYDQNGRHIASEYKRYNYSFKLSELYLEHSETCEYSHVVNGDGYSESFETLNYNEEYNDKGELTYWSKRETVILNGGCVMIRTETDIYGSKNVDEIINHNRESKPLTDISGWNEDKTVYTDAYEIYCNRCNASIEKYVNVTTYDSLGNKIGYVETYYVPYALSADEYGYRIEYVKTETFGVYSYNVGRTTKYVSYILSSIVDRYDESGNVIESSGTRYEYQDGGYCTYNTVSIVNGEDGYVSGPYTEHLAMRYELRLKEGATTCLDGLSRLRVCDCCDYEYLYSQHYTSTHSKEESTAEVIDLSAYSDCGGFLTVYSCPCGQRRFVETDNIGCNGALDSKTDYYYSEWYEHDGIWKYYLNKYIYGCSVTHDANGENICGFEYSVEAWRTVDENCKVTYHYVYTFTNKENGVEPLVISYSYKTNETEHRMGTDIVDRTYTEDGYYVRESAETRKCLNCSYLDYENVTKYYYEDENYNVIVKRTTERRNYSNGVIYRRYGYEYDYIEDGNGYRNDYQVYYFEERYSDGVVYSFTECTTKYQQLVHEGVYYGIETGKTVTRSGSDRNNITHVSISTSEYKYFYFDGKDPGFRKVKSVISQGTSENDLTYVETVTCDYDIVYSVDRNSWNVVTTKERYDYNDGNWRETVWDYSECYYAYTQTTTGSEYTNPEIYTQDHYWNNWYTDHYGYGKHPTCTDSGTLYRRCSWCEKVSEPMQMSALGHAYSEVYENDSYVYKCIRCGLVNFTSNDGAVTYEDFTGRLGNGTHFVVGFLFNYDRIEDYTLWVSVVDPNSDFEEFLSVEPTVNGKYIYLAAADVIEDLKRINGDWGKEYSLCDLNLRFAFVPNTDFSNFDCAITLDSHLPIYESTFDVDDYGKIAHTHSAVCGVCEGELEANAHLHATGFGYYNNGYYLNGVDYYCSACGGRYRTEEKIVRDSSDPCALVKVRYIYYGYDEATGIYANHTTFEVERFESHNYSEINKAVDLGNGKLFHGKTCATCGKTEGTTVTVASDYQLSYSVNPNNRQVILYEFTPTEDGKYRFYSGENTSDTYGYLYNSDLKELVTDDDGGDNNNFLIEYELVAGTTYYFGSRWYQEGNAGEYTVNLEKVN